MDGKESNSFLFKNNLGEENMNKTIKPFLMTREINAKCNNYYFYGLLKTEMLEIKHYLKEYHTQILKHNIDSHRLPERAFLAKNLIFDCASDDISLLSDGYLNLREQLIINKAFSASNFFLITIYP